MSGKSTRREFVRNSALAVTGMVSTAHSLPAQANRPASMGARFRQLLQRPEPFYCIAAFDGPSARLIELAGFESIFMGGSVNALDKGLPDWGLTNTSDLVEFAARYAGNVNIPVMADGDNGGGSPLTVYRFTQAFERAGLGAVMYEDRIRLERIGQKPAVVSTQHMVDQIRAAVDARTDMAIVARSDSQAAGLSVNEVIERGVAYAEAGADAVSLVGVTRIEDIRRAANAIPKPLFSQMVHDSPPSRAKEAGFHVYFYTSMMQDIALAAYNKALMELKSTGMVARTFEATRLPREITAQLERSQDILDRAAKYNVNR